MTNGPNDFDLFGEVVADPHGSLLGDEFIVPPFSVLSAREGWWQERKRKWLALGIQSELGRGGGHDLALPDQSAPGRSKMPAADYGKSHARGDGRGRAINAKKR